MAVYLGNDKVTAYGGIKTEIQGTNGQYNIDVVIEADGTQTLNITDWDYVPKPKFDRVFANNTPEQISMVSSEIAKNGYTSEQVKEIYGWDLQTDTTTMTLTSGETVEIGILGFNHDDLSDGSGKAGITLGLKNMMATAYHMNDTATNVGGYLATKMNNEILPTILELIPEDWRKVIRKSNKKVANGNKDDYTETVIVQSDIFLLSEIEILGTSTWAVAGDTEGQQYEYWVTRNTNALRKKQRDSDGDGIVDAEGMWWLRSTANASTTAMGAVYPNGTTGGWSASGSGRLSFACCI